MKTVTFHIHLKGTTADTLPIVFKLSSQIDLYGRIANAFKKTFDAKRIEVFDHNSLLIAAYSA